MSSLINRLKRDTKAAHYNDYLRDYVIDSLHADQIFCYKLALLQILMICKNVTSLFHPYKTRRSIAHEFSYFLTGFFYAGIGAALLIATIIAKPMLLISHLLQGKVLDAFLSLSNLVLTCFSAVLCSLAILLRGVIEVMGTPLFIARIPLRGLVSFLVGWQKFEENKGLKRALNRGEDLLKQELTPDVTHELAHLVNHLNEKAIKATALKQRSEILNFPRLAHVDNYTYLQMVERNKVLPGYLLPEQENLLYLDVKSKLITNVGDSDPELRVSLRKYFSLFKPISGRNLNNHYVEVVSSHNLEI